MINKKYLGPTIPAWMGGAGPRFCEPFGTETFDTRKAHTLPTIMHYNA